MLSKAIEIAGMACLVAFAYCVWPPYAFLAGFGVLMFLGYSLSDIHFPPLRRILSGLSRRKEVKE